jgi:hypothetical protein
MAVGAKQKVQIVMFIDRSIESVELPRFSPASTLNLAARLGRAPTSKWARGHGESVVVTILTAGVFVLGALLVLATAAQSLV